MGRDHSVFLKRNEHNTNQPACKQETKISFSMVFYIILPQTKETNEGIKVHVCQYTNPYVFTQDSKSVRENDFIIKAPIALLKREISKSQVDPFAQGHLDDPLASGAVAVAARVTQGGQATLGADHNLWTTAARRYNREDRR